MRTIFFVWLFMLCCLNYAQALGVQPGDLVGITSRGLLQIKQSDGNQSLFPPRIATSSQGIDNVLAVDNRGHLFFLNALKKTNSSDIYTSITQYDVNTGVQKDIYSRISKSTLRGIAVDSSGMIVIVYDSQTVSIIDPSNGKQTVIGFGPPFSDFTSILIDQNGDIILAASGNIFRVNPDSGQVDIVSSGEPVSLSGFPAKIAIDLNGDYLFLGSKFVRINRFTGETSEVTTSNGTLIDLSGSKEFFVDSNGDFVVTTESSISRVDSATGVETIIKTYNDDVISDIVSNSDDELFVSLWLNGSISKVNSITGESTLVVGDSLRAGSVVTISNNGRIFSAGGSGIIEINPKTAKTTIITSGGLLSKINGIVVDEDGTLFVSDANSVIRINPETGGQSEVSNFSSNIGDIALGMDGDIYVSTGRTIGGIIGGTIVRVDPITGAQTIVGRSEDDGRVFFSFGQRIAIEKSGDIIATADVLDEVFNRFDNCIVRMSSVTGSISIVTCRGFLDEVSVSDFVINSDGDIIFAASTARTTIVSINPRTGVQSILSEDGFFWISSMAIVPGNGIEVLPTTTTTTTSTTSTTIPTTKSFTFNCDHSMKQGFFFGLETLSMNVGDTENCTLKLTNLESGKTVEVSSQITNWFRSGIKIEPARSVTDENGEIEITITAIRKGKDWAAWAVPNDRGEFRFNKKTYDSGIAWGMFVQVK
ncbi:MAG: hypothetical protein ACUZ8E_13335 [Candidatus Anammoxibacter sp.]